MRFVLRSVIAIVITLPSPAQQRPAQQPNRPSEARNSILSEQELHRLMSSSSDDQFEVGHAYLTGLTGTPNYKKALIWYKKSADRGNLAAMNDIGRMYFEGWGVPRDFHKTLECFFLAASYGYPQAQYNLGLLYFKGLGASADIG